jgi:hypothetical protein
MPFPLYVFTRDFGEGQLAKESAIIIKSNVILFESGDSPLKGFGFKEAATVYDFNSHEPVVAIAPQGTSVCLLVSTSLTYAEATQILQAFNNSVVSAGSEVFLDGTGATLTPEDTEALFDSNPDIQNTCRHKLLLPTVPRDYGNANPFNGQGVEVKFSTLDSVVTIRVPGKP